MRSIIGLALALCLGVVVAAPRGESATQPAAARATKTGVGTYNIRDYGAVGDGNTPDTGALQAAIDACAKDQGGTVLVPAGVFVIGTTELKSNVTLHIAQLARNLTT